MSLELFWLGVFIHALLSRVSLASAGLSCDVCEWYRQHGGRSTDTFCYGHAAIWPCVDWVTARRARVVSDIGNGGQGLCDFMSTLFRLW